MPLTSLQNKGSYKVLIILRGECGRTLPRISKFKGRTDDMRRLSAESTYSLTQVETAPFLSEAVLHHYMMIVDREKITWKY